MRNSTIISLIILILSLVGCGDEPQKTPQTPTAPTTKPPATVVENSDEIISTGIASLVETISLVGNTYRVTVRGSIASNAILDVSIIQISGTPTAAIRVWVGDESGVGSIKTRVHSHGARSHARPQAPSSLPENSALWIEVQLADGTSETGFLLE